ncbi:hypothetical protein LRR74_28525, partial [Klebsiella pneumoniae]|nr:hypothetical protein [Klebsiella pneumoniae]
MLIRFESYQSRRYRREFAAIKERNLMKVRALSDELLKGVEPQEGWVRNVSSVIIPDRILKFLALGPKFGIDIPLGEVSMSRLL